jgi:hypothetical protein
MKQNGPVGPPFEETIHKENGRRRAGPSSLRNKSNFSTAAPLLAVALDKPRPYLFTNSRTCVAFRCVATLFSMGRSRGRLKTINAMNQLRRCAVGRWDAHLQTRTKIRVIGLHFCARPPTEIEGIVLLHRGLEELKLTQSLNQLYVHISFNQQALGADTRKPILGKSTKWDR